MTQSVLQRNENLQHKRFFQTIEKGDIQLKEMIDYAIVVLGKSKVGKTSSCHYLNNEILCGQNKGGDTVYKLSNANSRYKNAKIGERPRSQTQIPNIFTIRDITQEQGDKRLKLIDCPGYGDNYGCHRILSNAFFYYRVFSKVKNIKFVISFQRTSISSSATEFISTLIEFLSSFKNYDQIKQDILEASSFLFTKVQKEDEAHQNIRKRLRIIIQHFPVNVQEVDRINTIQFMQYILENQKIFIIPKALNGVRTSENQLLKKIYEKANYWKRQQSNNLKDEVDMKNISFTAKKQIQSNIKNKPMFKKGYQGLCEYQQNRAQKILGSNSPHEGSLVHVIQTITEDTMGTLTSHQFLDEMKKLIKQFYEFLDFKNQRKQLQKKIFETNHSQLRQKLSKNMVEQNLKETVPGYRVRDRNEKDIYWISKFYVTEFIIDIAKEMSTMDQAVRSVQQLNFMQQKYCNIIKNLNLIRFKRENSPQIIYKYGYLLSRLYEEAKVFTLIFTKEEQNCDNLEMSESFEQFFDIFRCSRDVIPQLNSRFRQIQSAKIQFLLSKDVSQFEQGLCEKSVHFFEDLQITEEQEANKNISDKVALQLKQVQLTLNLSRKIGDQITKSKSKLMILQLYKARVKMENIFKMQIDNEQLNQNNLEIIIAITNKIGHFLTKITNYKLAKQIYQSVKNVHKAIQVLRQGVQDQKQNNKKALLLIDLAEYAMHHCRKQTAVAAYQQAFSCCTDSLLRSSIANAILNENTSTNSHAYLQEMMNKQFFDEFDEVIKNQLIGIQQDHRN